MATPAPHGLTLADMLDAPGGEAQKWVPEAKAAEMLGKIKGHGPAKLAKARTAGKLVVGTIAGARHDSPEGNTRAYTFQTNGLAQCLMCRTKSGRQQVVLVDGERVGIRDFSGRELAALMGLPANYKLPESRNEAVRLTGDGLVVPMVRHLAAHLLEPLLAGQGERPRTAAATPPRARAARARKTLDAAVVPRKGIKGCTVGMTAYFLLTEAARLDAVAADMRVSRHELVIIALDGLLARRGEQPVRRYKKKE